MRVTFTTKITNLSSIGIDLTEEKSYEIINKRDMIIDSVNNTLYMIKNDKGIETEYNKDWFYPIEYTRNLIIDEVLNE